MTTTEQPTIVPIKQAVNLANHGILLLDSETLQDIYIKSGPLANKSEFQVHFWALIARYTFSDSILDIAIPTCFYNYKQEVSGAAIDFEMDDVSAMSKKTEPIHNMKVNELLNSKYKVALDNLIPEHIPTYIATELNSIHRHPGGATYQKFSATDLKTNPDDLGVVFPYDETNNNYPTFACIMAIDQGINKLARCEYRTVNGKLRENIVYTRHRAAAVVSLPIVKLSIVEQLFNIPQPQTCYILSDDGGTFAYEALSKLIQVIQYKPSTDLVSESNLSLKVYNTGSYLPKANTKLESLKLFSFTELYRLAQSLNIDSKALNKEDLIKDIVKTQEAKKESTPSTTKSKPKTTQKALPGLEVETETPIYSRVDLLSKSIDELIQIIISINYIYYGTTDSKSSILKDFSGSLDLKLDMIEYIEEVQGFLEDEEIEDLNRAIKKAAYTDPFYYGDYY